MDGGRDHWGKSESDPEWEVETLIQRGHVGMQCQFLSKIKTQNTSLGARIPLKLFKDLAHSFLLLQE